MRNKYSLISILFQILCESNHECCVLTSDYLKNGVQVCAEDKIIRKLRLHEAWSENYLSLSVNETSKYNANILNNVISDFEPDIVYFWNVYGLGLEMVKTVKKKDIPYTMHFMDLSID